MAEVKMKKISMKKYEKYKQSSVEWLGEVPEHWDEWKITHAIDLIGSGTTPKSDNDEYYEGDHLWVTTSELRENFISETKQKVSDKAIKDYSALKIYPKNSVAIAMYGATIGRLGILDKEATFNQACCVFGNSNILHYKFLFYWLWYRRPILISLSNGGGQPNLSQDDLKKLKLPLPTYEEQTAIANYLDNKLGEIDLLIGKQQTLLEKLAEQRTATITIAVTKGLNPNAPMKQSGVEWLGEVPEHWDIKPLKFLLTELKVGPFGSAIKTNDYVQDGKLLYNQRTVLDKNFSNHSIFITDEKYEELHSFEVKAGDFLLTTRGTIGKVAIVPDNAEKGIIHPCLIRFRVDQKFVIPKLIERIFNETDFFKKQLDLKSNATTIDVIYSNSLKELSLILPPLEEQTAIADYLDKETAKIDRLCDTVNQTINRLQEYRTALITQVVTGKIKVA
ncbi:restriction endonuclease subunit S [Actinobacillus equuli subsp. equuli]|uniref:restriction endonuclease subunit S n=1 Tax=Actinobacillus equuli TaxID=718 RepID=UPI0024424E35|nr:restriction endonuclease subunit S [Actinobacillus equuli]WGE54478.1 restriction endonuclease subunit S [Actinobacillus equuli subsp. equuli]